MSPTYSHGFHIYDGDVGGFEESVKLAGDLHADTVRIGVNWPDLQPTATGPMNTVLLESLRNIVMAGRERNPSLSALICFDQAPPWAAGYAYRGVSTPQGWDQYASALVYLAQYLAGTHASITSTYPVGDPHRIDLLRGVELSNEANQNNPKFNGAIPSSFYGGMAAYAAHRLYYCAPGKLVLIGALATGSGPSYADGSWQSWINNVKGVMYAWLVYLTQNVPTAQAIFDTWRLSFHPYPHLGTWQSTIEPTNPANTSGDLSALAADATVGGIVAAAQAQAVGHPMWITEIGVSSRKLNYNGQNGPLEQALFAQLQHARAAGNSQIEGLLFWPLTDSDIDQVKDIGTGGVGGEFFNIAVVAADGTTKKPAAASLQALWA